jgi:hypothetical protein
MVDRGEFMPVSRYSVAAAITCPWAFTPSPVRRQSLPRPT